MDTKSANPLKFVAENDTELRVGNYIALWGDPQHRDWYQEYFTANTNFESSYTKSGVLYVDFEHGHGPEVDGGIGPDVDDVLGVVDWKTARKDSNGLWVERVLNRRNEYVEMLKPLIEAGLMGTSSEAIAGKHRVDPKTGEIIDWPLKRDSLTVMPAEPRMLTDNVVAALKSIGKYPVREVKPEVAEAAAETETGKSSGKAAKEKVMKTKKDYLQAYADEIGIDIVELNDEQKAKALEGTEFGKKTQVVTIEDAKNLAKQAADEAVKAISAKLPADNSAGVNVEVVTDEADQPFKSAGEFFMAVKEAAVTPARMDVRLRSRKAALGANESVPSDGGFLLQDGVDTQLNQRMYQLGNVLNRVSMTQVGPNSNGMSFPRVDETSRVDGSRYGGILGYWLEEAGTKTATKPKFDRLDLRLKKVAAVVYSTDEMLQDSTALESWINQTVPDELRFQAEAAIYRGDGIGKPLGIMNSNALVSVTRVDANEIDVTDVSNMWARRWAGQNDYVWLANQAIHPQLQVMAIANQPVYVPAGGFADRPFATLFGAPIIDIEYASALGTTGDLMLASLSQYKAISKGGIQAASSIHVQFLTDETAFRFVYRIDGAPNWKSPLTPYQGSATQSPFVVLSTSS